MIVEPCKKGFVRLLCFQPGETYYCKETLTQASSSRQRIPPRFNWPNSSSILVRGNTDSFWSPTGFPFETGFRAARVITDSTLRDVNLS